MFASEPIILNRGNIRAGQERHVAVSFTYRAARRDASYEASCRSMSLTIREAAEAIGKSKATITRAIRSGRISATREPSGAFLIDEAELYRVFKPASETRDTSANMMHHDAAVLRREVELLREQIATQAATIEDLRRRLDREAEERRQAQEKLTAVLTDQRPKRRWWWPW